MPCLFLLKTAFPLSLAVIEKLQPIIFNLVNKVKHVIDAFKPK